MGIAAAIIGGGAALAGAAITGSAAKSAAKTQANAADQAAATQLKMYDTTRSDLMPYMNTGNNALAQLAKLWGIGPGGTGMPDAAAATSALTKFPGYEFGLDQGVQALDRSAASRGLVLSGAQLKDSQQFGQQYAMANAWNPYITQLSALATMGQDSAAKVGTIGTQAGQNIGASQIAAGQATAAGQVGLANSLTGGIQNALLAYQLYGPGAGGGGGGGQINPSMFPTTTPNNQLDAAFNAGITSLG